jgi:hypothetical protein
VKTTIIACTTALLACAAHAAPPPPSLTPDLPVDAPVISAALGDQTQAALAYGGTGANAYYFAVWQEQTGAGPYLVRGARFDASGQIKDTPALVIATTQTFADPAVAFDGTSFVVVYLDGSTPQVQRLTVDPATATIGSPTQLTTSMGQKVHPVVAGGGNTSLVCWQVVAGADQCTYFAGNTASSTVNNLQVSENGKVGDHPSVTWGGATANNFLVLYEDYTGVTEAQVRGALVDATGVKAGSQQAISIGTAGVAEPTAASNGTTYVAYWADFRNAGAGTVQIWQRTVGFTGTLGATDNVTAQSSTDDYRAPQAIFAGGTLFLVWKDVVYGGPVPVEQLFGGRFTVAGTTTDGAGAGASISLAVPQVGTQESDLLPTDPGSMRRAIASDPAGHVMTAWVGTVTPQQLVSVSGYDVFALPTDLSATPLPATLPAVASTFVSQEPSYQRAGGAASNGTTALVVWEDTRNLLTTGVDIYGMRYRLDGTAIDAAPFPICKHSSDQFEPAVAAIPGGDFLVAWADARNLSPTNINGLVSVYATRVGADGTVKDGDGQVLSSDTTSNGGKVTPSVASTANGWLVAWEDMRSSTSTTMPISEVWANLVAANGTVGAETKVSTSACAPAATFDGTRYLVAYETPCSRDLMSTQSDIAGHWVSTAGVVEAATVTIANTADSETAPAVASDGKRAYVVWRAQTTAGAESILGGPIADDATTLAQTPTKFGNSTGQHLAPSISMAVPAANSPVGLVAWIGSATEGVQGARVDGSFAIAPEGVFTLQAGAMFETTFDFTKLGAALPTNGNGLARDARYTPPAALATAPTGETLVAFNPLVTLGGVLTPRVHTRKLGIVGLGQPCLAATACGLGFCTGGACCDTACDGICQACGVNGCVETPQSDARCPAMSVSCAALTTECRVFTDPPANRCVGFGECASSASLAECTTYNNAADGTACTSACGGMGMCMAGTCACMSVAPAPYVRTLPATGCSVASSHERPGALLGVLLLAVVVAFRRRLRFVLLALLAGCGGNQVALDVTLHFDDPVLAATDHARIVISSSDGNSFPAMAVTTIKPGLTVTNEDADGDGKVDIVLTLGKDYAFARDNRFRLLNGPLTAPLGLALRAEAFDNLGNRFARIGGASADPAATSVQALLNPGQETQAAQLKPTCFNNACTDSTLHLAVSDAALSITLLDVPTALAVGGVMRNDVLVGAAHADSTQGGLARPNGGLAWLYQGGATPSTMPNLTVAGAAGAELGAAVAIGDLDGDGAAELLLGAPGVDNGAGAVFVVWGGGTPPSTLDLAQATLPMFVSVVTGAQPNDRLGASLAVVDVGGGKLDLLAGADGAAAVYDIRATTLTRGAATAVGQSNAVTGPAGSRFGASVAAAAGRIVIGAPTQGGKGAVYSLALTDLGSPAKTAGAPTMGQGGGFGDAVAAIDVDGSGTALAVAAAPDDGPGTTSVLASSTMLVQASAPLSRMGASLARLPWPGGDAVVLGAPSPLPTASPGAGSVVIVRGTTLGLVPQLVVGADGRPAAVSITGAHAGDGVGTQVAVGDLDGDGFADVLVTSASKSLLVFRGPLL